MHIFTPIRQDKTWLLGLGTLAISLLVFLIPKEIRDVDSSGGIFTVNYILALIYLFILLSSGRLRKGRNGLGPFYIFLMLALVSCYSLNRLLPVFQDSVDWWCVLLVIICATFLSLPFYSRLPFGIRSLICFIAGLAFAAFLYLSLYLAPLYIFGLLGTIAFGIGVHVFIPPLFIIYNLVFIRRAFREDKRIIYPYLGAIFIVALVVIQFTVQWGNEVQRMDDLLYQPNNATDSYLPSWVRIAQATKPNTYNERFLKAGLVYETAGNNWDLFSWDSHRQFNEEIQHDPLITTASFLEGKSNLEDNDRIKILESLYDSRQKAQERLWRGDDLVTSAIATNTELWPQSHLSYTEETLTVTNKALRSRFNSTQEALYSFHLPEGAVVSSLSLWINGKEQPALLSSRHKADSAYTAIVGYENRDPCVVHWQEGNIVTIRVFPVQAQESRRFKIGITAPLQKRVDRLVYHSTYFDGPPATYAKSTTHIRSLQPLKHADPLPPNEGAYNPDWSIQFDDPGLAHAAFDFNGHQYLMQPYVPAYAPVHIQDVYLDINTSWTHTEYTELLDALYGKTVYAIDPNLGMVIIGDANKEQVFTACNTQQFSLFPLALITDKEHSLLISKCAPVSPFLSDLRGSDFSDSLKTYLAKPGKVMLYNLGEDLSPYLKSLKEVGAFDYDQGDVHSLITRIKVGTYIQDINTPDQAVISAAGLLIVRTDTAPKDSTSLKAPDHLLRLFAYNRIMQQLDGQLPGDYRDEDPSTIDTLVQTAEEAHIVSPVSSLVVLETKDDYKRFNILESKNALKNAGIHSKGAVPEPGEWAIIGLCMSVFVCIRLKKTLQSLSL